MKTELSKIAQDFEKGTITDKEARKLLLGLLSVSKSVFVKDVDGIRHLFPWQFPRQPQDFEEYLLFIKTRRGNKHYIVKGKFIIGDFSVKGFSKFKVIGWRELS